MNKNNNQVQKIKFTNSLKLLNSFMLSVVNTYVRTLLCLGLFVKHVR